MILRRAGELLSAAALLGLGLYLAADPAASAEIFSEGLRSCACGLLPALFPFFVIGQLLTESPGSELLALPLRPVCRMLGLRSPKAPLLLFLGWVGGYSTLAVSLHSALLREELSPQEANRLLVAGVISSPGFTAAVGGMLGRPLLGAVLYGSTLAANLGCALLLRLFCPPLPVYSPVSAPVPPPHGLGAAIAGAVSGSLTVCGCVVFFRMALVPFTNIPVLPPSAVAALAGMAEVSSGCMAWSKMGGMAVAGCCLTMSLLSFSVWNQLRALLGGRCSLRLLALTRPLHAALSLAVLRGLLRLIPGETAVLSTLQAPVIVLRRLPADSVFFLFALCCLVLEKLRVASLYKGSDGNYNGQKTSKWRTADV